MNKVTVGDIITLRDLNEIVGNYFNEHNELVFDSVSVHITQLAEIYKRSEDEYEIEVVWVDEDGDFKIFGNNYTFANELIMDAKEVENG